MRVTMEVVVAEGTGRPPIGAPVVAEVRDTTLQDAGAVTLARAEASVAPTGPLAEVALEFDQVPGGDVTAFAHVDVNGDGRLSRGDWVNVASVPISGARVRVVVTPI